MGRAKMVYVIRLVCILAAVLFAGCATGLSVNHGDQVEQLGSQLQRSISELVLEEEETTGGGILSRILGSSTTCAESSPPTAAPSPANQEATTTLEFYEGACPKETLSARPGMCPEKGPEGTGGGAGRRKRVCYRQKHSGGEWVQDECVLKGG